MIARVWRGWATPQAADAYQHHYESDVAEPLHKIPGSIDACLLLRLDGDEVMFTSIVIFSGMPAVHAFAGERPEVAVVELAARRALVRWDEQVAHHDVVVRLT